MLAFCHSAFLEVVMESFLTRYLISRFGAIELRQPRTRVGTSKDMNIHLVCPDLSPWHASILYKADGKIVIINHSDHQSLFINERPINPGEKFAITDGDIIRFSFNDVYKLVFDFPDPIEVHDTPILISDFAPEL